MVGEIFVEYFNAFIAYTGFGSALDFFEDLVCVRNWIGVYIVFCPVLEKIY